MARRSVGERQAEANKVYGDKLGSFERSLKSTRQRKLYLLRLLMKQFKAVQELLNDFAFPHHSNTELCAKETSSGSARTTTSWMKNEIVIHKELSAVSITRSSSAMSLTANERLLEELANIVFDSENDSTNQKSFDLSFPLIGFVSLLFLYLKFRTKSF
ncbi:hypothetical protein ISN45_Aa08g002320 [Arabidopsis thaliana x Arabidopsis arenosa]|uniref:Uncharacterized protein n=1 Tax=Arabidopsis thaliana x Arabidopsis arenosa TaxID=1240361 RepID=A0A8T1XDJ8_9BRAS|nr:hypothetical protein ISN45_Aa08g002320 [Arabidopsis thaliana x Arabidopsis arenosa]